MQQYAKLKNGDKAITETANEDVKSLPGNYVMASINGGKFQPLHKSKIKETANFDIS